MLVYFHYLDKNSEWVIDGNGYVAEDYQTCASPVDVLVEIEALMECSYLVVPLSRQT